MQLLAFDTSTDRMSIAVQRAGQIFTHQGAGGAQSSAQMLPSILRLMAQAGLDFAQLDAIVFGRGPGSFTGLRTACAVAPGLGFGAGGGRGVPVLAVDSLLAVAEQARLEQDCTHVWAVLDARMDEVYHAPFVWHGGNNDRHGTWQAGADFAVSAPQTLLVPAGYQVAGNAHAVYGERLAPQATHIAAWPSAQALLSLAPGLLAQGLAVSAEQALPLYVRDKVAQTTAERSAARDLAMAEAAAAAGGTP